MSLKKHNWLLHSYQHKELHNILKDRFQLSRIDKVYQLGRKNLVHLSKLVDHLNRSFHRMKMSLMDLITTGIGLRSETT